MFNKGNLKSIMKNKFKRLNVNDKVLNFKWFMRPLIDVYTLIFTKYHKMKITYNNGAENINAPFILLANHNSMMDFPPLFKVTRHLKTNIVAELPAMQGRYQLMRWIGIFGNRKFVGDPSIVMQMKRVIDRGNVLVIYPEARFSLCGTTAVLPESLGKMIKMFNVPVLTMISHGHHINQPTWNQWKDRGVKGLRSDISLFLDKKDIESLEADEINERLVEAFQYDDFAWQKEHNIIIDSEDRAEGLHRLLYQCPHCGKEFDMSSKGTILKCDACGKEWEMTELGELKAKEGETEFSHIPNWYEWQRSNIRKEIENGTFSIGPIAAKVESLPNASKWIDIGTAKVSQDMDGFKCILDDPSKSDISEIVRKPLDNYSAHIEYMYRKKPLECLDLSTKTDTWFIYPTIDHFSVTKFAIATEELFQYNKKKLGKPIIKGLA